MALVTSINVVVQDGKGARSTTTFNLPSGLSIADLTETAQQGAQLIANLINGQVVSVQACIGIDISALTNNTGAAGTVDVEEGARFIFQTINGFSTSMRLPTFAESRVTLGGNDVDQTDPDVIAFKSFMENGFTTGGATLVQPVDTRNEDITSLKTAKEDFQRTRKI